MQMLCDDEHGAFDLVIQENVKQYPMESVCQKTAHKFDWKICVLNPMLLGQSTCRVRTFAAGTNKDTMKWTTEQSLMELLQPFFAVPQMRALDFFTLTRQEVLAYNTANPNHPIHTRALLAPSDLKHLKGYTKHEVWKNRDIIDLRQNPETQPTGSSSDGRLQTLTTHCNRLYAPSHERCMASSEVLESMGLPQSDESAALLGIPKYDYINVRPKAIIPTHQFEMAGNGMHVPTLGAIFLIMMLYVEKIGDSIV
jgi:hypothetical protein